MVREEALYPYDDYYIYKVYHKNEGRYYANLIPKNKNSGLKRKTISYARYLMSVKEQRILNNDEHVDHIDNNKLNDNPNNLQILTPIENNLKEAKRRGIHVTVLKCPNCGKIFEKRKRNTYLIRGNNYTACCRHCSGKFSILMQYNPNDPIVLENINNAIFTYIKHIDYMKPLAHIVNNNIAPRS